MVIAKAQKNKTDSKQWAQLLLASHGLSRMAMTNITGAQKEAGG